jgi:heat shock protein HslJ
LIVQVEEVRQLANDKNGDAMKRSKFTLLMFLALSLAACATLPVTEPRVPVTGESTATTQPTEDNLAGSGWELVSFGPVGTPTHVTGGVPITIAFGKDGQVGGHGGCNSYGGPYTVQNDSLEFGEITSTLVACTDQTLTEQEQQYLEALRTAGRFAVEGDTLKIWYQNDGSVLNFARSSGMMIEPSTGMMTDIAETGIPSPVEPPERIEFNAGATSVQRSGLLPSGPGMKQYVVAGSAGQTTTVNILSDGVPLGMTITMPNGSQRIPEMSPAGAGGYKIAHEFTLPESGDYIVTLIKADHTPSTNYTADFTIK